MKARPTKKKKRPLNPMPPPISSNKKLIANKNAPQRGMKSV